MTKGRKLNDSYKMYVNHAANSTQKMCKMRKNILKIRFCYAILGIS